MISSRFVGGAIRRWTLWLDDEKSLPYRMFAVFLPFVLGALSAYLLEQFFEQTGEGRATVAAAQLLASAGLVIAIVAFMNVMMAHYSGIRAMNMFMVEVWRDDPRTVRATAYDGCALAARRAEKSIKVVSPHFARGLLDSETPSHNDYLTDGIFNALRLNLDRHEDREPFEYQRIIQIESPTHLKDLKTTHRLRLEHINDRALFVHICYCLFFDPLPNMDVKIYATAVLPSFPSTLIIDDTSVFFSLPTNLSGDSWRSDDDPVKERGRLQIDFVLGLRDQTRRAPVRFKHLFDKLKNGAAHIAEPDFGDFKAARVALKDLARMIEKQLPQEMQEAIARKYGRLEP